MAIIQLKDILLLDLPIASWTSSPDWTTTAKWKEYRMKIPIIPDIYDNVWKLAATLQGI